MGNFIWLYHDEDTLILKDREQELTIAKLGWNSVLEEWHLCSHFLKLDMDMGVEFRQNDVDEVENAAIAYLIDNCQERIDWWESRIEMLQEMQDEVNKDE